ncbi:MAG: hypothetical protein HUJ27_05005 [Rhodobacteraceae bacterium]|nr:hypothetical protein [Paracoccaceae bacterium]
MNTKGAVKVFTIVMSEYSNGLQIRLLHKIFKDRCSKCDLPSYVEIESPPEINHPPLTKEIGLACGFWLARIDFARAICAEFEGQFEIRKISDDACFLVLKNVLVPEDPDYKDRGEALFRDQEPICSLCGKPYVLLFQGINKFVGGNLIKPRTIYETSVKFGSADVKYPFYFCDEEAARALKALSRKFAFVKSMADLSVVTT